MNNINIFVSSTCYDLSQIRTDISDFISICGHKPILSEYESFPVSPDLSTIENCMKNVRENADILVLIVGNRYGSVIENGKSITNNEFLVAKQKGIPIFCFVDKRIINVLDVWKENRNGKFSNIVDNTEIFEFISEIRDNLKIWCFPFEKAQDIIDTLKIQMSYLFKEGLQAKRKIDNNVSDVFQLNLSSKALKIIVEKEDLYEHLFLYQVLIDELEKKEFLKHDIEYLIEVEPKHIINDLDDVYDWAIERIKVFQRILGNFDKLINNALNVFLNEPGIPADLKGLYYVAVKYAQFYESFLDWCVETRSTYIDDKYKHIKMHLSEYVLKPSEQVWNYPFNVKMKLEEAKRQKLPGEDCSELDLGFSLETDEEVVRQVTRDLEKIVRRSSCPKVTENQTKPTHKQ